MAIIQRTITEDETFKVPADVTSIDVELYGAQGGNSTSNLGGRGGRVTGTLLVTPEEELDINIGKQPTDATGGANGGGNGVDSGSAPDIAIQDVKTAGNWSHFVSVLRPSGVVEGDLLVAFVRHWYSEGDGTLFTPTGWTAIPTEKPDGYVVGVYYKTATASEPTSYTFNGSPTDSTNRIEVAVVRVTGVNTAHGVDAYSTQLNTGNILVPSVNATQNNSIAFVVYAYQTSNTDYPNITYPSSDHFIARLESGDGTIRTGLRVEAFNVDSGATSSKEATSDVTLNAYGMTAVFVPAAGASGGGGGATDIRQGGTALANRAAVAAGGGGAATDSSRPGGAGGGLSGLKPGSSAGAGGGGTQSAGGAAGDLGNSATAGALGVGGDGDGTFGGGGGGGYYGGGGGDSYGGGGGSSYVGGLQGGTTQSGINTGHGYAVLTYDDPAFDPEPPVVTVEAAEDANGPHALVTIQAQHNEDNFIGPGSYTIERKFHDEDDFKAIAEGDYTERVWGYGGSTEESNEDSPTLVDNRLTGDGTYIRIPSSYIALLEGKTTITK